MAFLLICLPTFNATGQDEAVGVTATVLNCMEGWYQGDARRMKASLYNKLAKRSLQEGYGTRELRS